MKAIHLQNALLTIIAVCLVYVCLTIAGVLEFSYNGDDIPIRIESVANPRTMDRGGALPVTVVR